ncbi:MAG: MinD/ParA family protein [Sarcina sp.]
MLDQAASLRDLVRVREERQTVIENKTKVMTITSGKGGVGKSNIVVNIAISLSKMGKKVLVFDADIGMGNDDIILGVQSKYSVNDVVNRKVTIKEAMVRYSEGVYLLSGGSGLNKIEELSNSQRESFIEALKSINDFDYILMDTGAGVSRTVLGFVAAADEVLLITTPEPTAITDAYSLVKAIKHFNLKAHVSVIVNRSYTEKEGKDTYEKFSNVAKKFLGFELKYLGYILEDRKLIEAVKKQVPLVVSYPSSDSNKCIEKIAAEILGNKTKSAGAQGFFKKLFDLFV